MRITKTALLMRIKQTSSKEFPQKSYTFERYFGISGTAIRQIVQELRREGIPIVSCSKGYYYDNSPEAIKMITEDMESRAMSMLNTVKILKNNFVKQEELF